MVGSGQMVRPGKELGQRLRTLRVASGLTQFDLAAQCGLHRMSINRYERGHYIPPLRVVEQLSATLGVSASWLVYGVEPMA